MYDIKKVQAVQLEIFENVYKICKKNNIPIFLAYGSAIGAVRHKGFIPWDDDIDVFVFYKDRKRFMDALRDSLPQKFFYQSKETDAGYRLMIDRVRNSETTMIESDKADWDINHGIHIDIFFLFNCAEKKWDYLIQRVASMLYRLFLFDNLPKNHGKLKRIASSVVLKIFPKYIKRRVIKNAPDYIQKKGSDKFFSTFYGDDEHIKYESELFLEAIEVDFEDGLYPIPSGNHKILTLNYGNYMRLPPVEERTIHHDFYMVDCEKAYKEYLKNR